MSFWPIAVKLKQNLLDVRHMCLRIDSRILADRYRRSVNRENPPIELPFQRSLWYCAMLSLLFATAVAQNCYCYTDVENHYQGCQSLVHQGVCSSVSAYPLQDFREYRPSWTCYFVLADAELDISNLESAGYYSLFVFPAPGNTTVKVKVDLAPPSLSPSRFNWSPWLSSSGPRLLFNQSEGLREVILGDGQSEGPLVLKVTELSVGGGVQLRPASLARQLIISGQWVTIPASYLDRLNDPSKFILDALIINATFDNGTPNLTLPMPVIAPYWTAGTPMGSGWSESGAPPSGSSLQVCWRVLMLTFPPLSDWECTFGNGQITIRRDGARLGFISALDRFTHVSVDGELLPIGKLVNVTCEGTATGAGLPSITLHNAAVRGT
jgi:hypothetical protein